MPLDVAEPFTQTSDWQVAPAAIKEVLAAGVNGSLQFDDEVELQLMHIIALALLTVTKKQTIATSFIIDACDDLVMILRSVFL